jgi:hypothetical protein
MSHSDGPRHGAFKPSISATSQSLDGLDTLADSGDELSSLTDLLSRARPVGFAGDTSVDRSYDRLL